MNDTVIIDCLKSYFKTEISNKFEFVGDDILIYLDNGVKAKISVTKYN